MASDLSQDAVLCFLRSKDGKVKNSDLLCHFKAYLREDANREQNRELFKRFVNSVAVVKQEEGVSFVVLKKRYMVHTGDACSLMPSWEKGKKWNQTGLSSREENGTQEIKGLAFPQTKLKLKPQPVSQVEGFNTFEGANNILPSAGIITKVETSHIDNLDQNSPFSTLRTPLATTSNKFTDNRTSTLQLPAPKVLDVTKKPQEQESEKTFAASVNCDREIGSIVKLRPPEEFHVNQKTFSEASDHLYRATNVSLTECPRQNNVEAVRKESKHQDLECSSSDCFLNTTSRNHCRSSSYKMGCHKDLDDMVVSQALTSSNRRPPRPKEILEKTTYHQQEDRVAAVVGPHFFSHNFPLENLGPTAASYSDSHRSGLSASHGDLLMPSYNDPEWPEKSPKEEWASDEGLNLKGLSGNKDHKVYEMLLRAQESKLSMLHRAERKVTTWHHSTGDLNNVPRAAEVGAETGVPVPLRSIHRGSSEFRSRMCRSLGADLDQTFHEDVVLARKNRLYLLSSSLSMNHLTRPSQINRSGDVATFDVEVRNVCASEGLNFHRNTSVPLDLKEHDWMLKAASGCWTEIYALFREDPSLLTKRDFISGYTVLHWIAKHGDHRVLNTLWYGVSKAGLNLDIDTKTTCGYTPLHLAAIHGHRKLIRLLVHKFRANVSLRDTSGKKPWQYLNGSRDLLELLGAPRRKAPDGKLVCGSSLERLLIQPNTTSPSVKRQTSIAAFLKHKSVLKTPAHSESFV